MEKQKKIQEIIKKIEKDPVFRKNIVKRSHFYFFNTFFPHYMEYPCSWFQKEMFTITEDPTRKVIIIMAFRGSGKSTIMNLSFSLWSIFGIHQKKFVLLVSRTKKQSRVHFDNIKNEMIYNDLLRNDLGPFQIDSEDWGLNSLILKKFGAKVMTIGINESLRGLRYGNHRPDLIIFDDIEDTTCIDNAKERKKIFDWVDSEAFTVGNKDTTMVFLGNLLSEDSILITLKRKIEDGYISGIFRAYPLLDDNNAIVWPEKFKTPGDVLDFKKSIMNNDVWSRDYLLRIPGVNMVFIVCTTREEVEQIKETKNEEFIVRNAPINPQDYRISAPTFGGIRFETVDASGKKLS